MTDASCGRRYMDENGLDRGADSGLLRSGSGSTSGSHPDSDSVSGHRSAYTGPSAALAVSVSCQPGVQATSVPWLGFRAPPQPLAVTQRAETVRRPAAETAHLPSCRCCKQSPPPATTP